VKHKIRISPLVLSDVDEIKMYIAENNLSASEKICTEIYSLIEKLGDYPELGVSLSSKINLKSDFRYLVCSKLLIFYKIEGEFISIYRILNGQMDYLSILFDSDFIE
jgi:plasmid stabilization system protein ParE